jgi:hypothetical protein
MEHQGEYLRQGAMPADMSMDEHMQMMARRHLATLWCHFLNIILGLWLISAPFVFGYLNVGPDDYDLARLAAERSLPDVATRSLLMTWSDVVSGVLIVIFAGLSLSRRCSGAISSNPPRSRRGSTIGSPTTGSSSRCASWSRSAASAGSRTP